MAKGEIMVYCSTVSSGFWSVTERNSFKNRRVVCILNRTSRGERQTGIGANWFTIAPKSSGLGEKLIRSEVAVPSANAGIFRSKHN